MKNNLYIRLLMLFSSITFFVLGLVFPIIGTKKQLLGITLSYQEIKLFDSIKLFYESNDFLLAGIIFLFTIFLPIIKYFELLNRILTIFDFSKKINQLLHLLDKWSMLDVFLVALLLLNFKMDSSFVVMHLKIGTNFLAVSIVLRMIVSNLTNIKIEKYYG